MARINLLLWMSTIFTTVTMENSGDNSAFVTSLFGFKGDKNLSRGCPPPIKEFDHQGRKRYERVELWEVIPTSMPQVAMLNLMLLGSEGKTMIFSEEPHSINRTFEVMFKNIVKQSGPKMLQEMNIRSKRIYQDLQEYLDLEWKRLNPLPKGYHKQEFNTYDQILGHLEEIATKCSGELQCALKTIGKTGEDRDIGIFRIVPETRTRRPVIWIDATRSAYHWLAAATLVELAQTLVEESKKNTEMKKLVGSFDWVFLPVANPDGYVYSWNKDRFFSKNRSPTSDPSCHGVHLDSNFDYKIEGRTIYVEVCYSKFRECFDFHNGTKQEPETAAVLEEMAELGETVMIWLNIKQGPWRITLPESQCRDNMDQMVDVVKQTIQDKTLKKPWTLDENCNSVYKTAGRAMDYIQSSSLAKYAMTVEIGGSTFDVTAKDIPESTRELQQLLLVLKDKITQVEDKSSMPVHDEI